MPTDHFYKFLALFGLLVSIFCYSFPVIFLKPYNEEMLKQNLQSAELGAEIGFLEGKIADINESLQDNLKKVSVEYFYSLDKNKSKSVYYYSKTKNISVNNEIERLNNLNYQLAKSLFKMHAIKISHKARQKNLHLNELASYIIGTIATLVSILVE